MTVAIDNTVKEGGVDGGLCDTDTGYQVGDHSSPDSGLMLLRSDSIVKI